MSIELQMIQMLHYPSEDTFKSVNKLKAEEIFNRSRDSGNASLIVLHGSRASGKSTVARRLIEMFKSSYPKQVTVTYDNNDEIDDRRVEKNDFIIVHIADQIKMSSIEYANDVIKRLSSRYKDSKIIAIVELLTAQVFRNEVCNVYL